MLSVPSIWGTETIATLNLYSRTGPFDETAATVAAVLAAQVAIAVSRSPEFVAARAVVEEAQRNADDHSQIAMATGLLIGSQDCTREQAEGLLRQAAAEDEQTILQIAQRIIEQHRSTRQINAGVWLEALRARRRAAEHGSRGLGEGGSCGLGRDGFERAAVAVDGRWRFGIDDGFVVGVIRPCQRSSGRGPAAGRRTRCARDCGLCCVPRASHRAASGWDITKSAGTSAAGSRHAPKGADAGRGNGT